MNAGPLMDVRPLLEVARRRHVSTLAWLWKRSSTDRNALLGADGEPYDRRNGQWGSVFLDWLEGLGSVRAPSGRHP